MTAKKHLFISYSRKNTEFVNRLIQDLDIAGIPYWIDHEGIDFGTDWQLRIKGGIRDAYALLLVASADSAASRYVRDEVHIAEMYQCPVFLVWAAGENWADCAPFGYIGSQYADARDSAYSAGIARVVKTLKPENFQQQASATNVSTPMSSNSNPRNPYKGLRAFTAEDKADYFGRDMLIPELAQALQQARFLAVMGPSGSGKSSVVMAGLLPYLQAGNAPNSENWLYFDPILPGVEPLKSLADALAKASGEDSTDILEDLKENIRELHKIMRRLARNDDRAVLFIDQFEELFTQTAHEAERRQFIDLLTTAVNEPQGKTTVVITLRADFYDRPMNYEHLGKLIETHSKSLLPMTLEELRRVIELPAQKEKMTFETGLVGDLLFEVSGQTGALPLLQFMLYQLFEQRKEQLLTTAAYRQLGGVRGALRLHAEKTYMALTSNKHRSMARALFLRLIEPGATEQDTTRRRARRSELELVDAEQTQILRETAEVFIHARLIMADKDTIEISHEALIREWQLLAGWLQTARDDMHFQQMLSRDTEEWIRKGRPRDNYLYHGAKLEDAKDWETRNIVSADEKDFIITSTRHFDTLEAQMRTVTETQLLQDAIIQNVSHELRTPLLQIKSTIALLADDISDKQLILYAEGAVTRLERLIRDVSGINQSDDFNPIILKQAVEYVIKNLRGIWQSKNDIDRIILLIDEELPQVVADKAGLVSVLQHLIDNALKFSKTNGTNVEIIGKQDGDKVFIGVRDYGIGISENQLEKIFDVFIQLDVSSTRRYGGLGLGLALVKSILERHQSKIEVKSILGEGSIFYFYLPAANIQ